MTQRRSAGANDAEIRSIIVAEVAKQLKPFVETVDKVHEWQLAWWSNGSGRPPGFFQLRMAQDDERNKIVMDFIKTAQTRQIEEEDRKKRSEARWAFWWPKIKWVGGGVGIALLALAGYIGPKAVHVGWILFEDYENRHPGLSEQIKKADAQPNAAVLSRQKPIETADQ